MILLKALVLSMSLGLLSIEIVIRIFSEESSIIFSSDLGIILLFFVIGSAYSLPLHLLIRLEKYSVLRIIAVSAIIALVPAFLISFAWSGTATLTSTTNALLSETGMAFYFGFVIHGSAFSLFRKYLNRKALLPR